MDNDMSMENLLDKFGELSVGVIGDLCLDVYWTADMKKSILSRETPHYPLPVVEERMYPGGGANVVNNIAALKPLCVKVFGIIGDDWRGCELSKRLDLCGVDTSCLLKDKDRVTNCYIKPIRKGISNVIYEDPRIDFESPLMLSEKSEGRLLECIMDNARALDVICVCDQMEYGIITPRIREALCQLGREGKLIIVDSRDRIGLYRDVIVKPNDLEACRAAGTDDPYQAAKRLSEINHRTVFVTMGEDGCLVAEQETVVRALGFKVKPPVDICGAGDTFMASLACSLATGIAPKQAAVIGNLAASITIKKLGITGTASRQELQKKLMEQGMNTM